MIARVSSRPGSQSSQIGILFSDLFIKYIMKMLLIESNKFEKS